MTEGKNALLQLIRHDRVIICSGNRYVITLRDRIKYIKSTDAGTCIHYYQGKIEIAQPMEKVIQHYGFELFVELGAKLRINAGIIRSFHMLNDETSEIEFNDGTFLLLNGVETMEMTAWLHSIV